MVVLSPSSFGDLLANAPRPFGDTTFQQRSNSDAERESARRLAEINAKNLLDTTRLQGSSMLAREEAARQGERDYLTLKTRLETKNALRTGLFDIAAQGIAGGSGDRFAGSADFVSKLMGAAAPRTSQEILQGVNGTVAGLNQTRTLLDPWSARARGATEMGITLLGQ